MHRGDHRQNIFKDGIRVDRQLEFEILRLRVTLPPHQNSKVTRTDIVFVKVIKC